MRKIHSILVVSELGGLSNARILMCKVSENQVCLYKLLKGKLIILLRDLTNVKQAVDQTRVFTLDL